MKKIFLLAGAFFGVGNCLCVSVMYHDNLRALAQKILKPTPLSIYEYNYDIVSFKLLRGTSSFVAVERRFRDEWPYQVDWPHTVSIDDVKIVESDFCASRVLDLEHLNHDHGTTICFGFDRKQKALLVFDLVGKIEDREYFLPGDVDTVVPIHGTTQFVVKMDKKSIIFMDYLKTYLSEADSYCVFNFEEEIDHIEVIPQTNYVVVSTGNNVAIFDREKICDSMADGRVFQFKERIWGLEAVPGTKKVLIYMWRSHEAILVDVERGETYSPFKYRGDPGENLRPFSGTSKFLLQDHDHKTVVLLDVQDEFYINTFTCTDRMRSVFPVPGSPFFWAEGENKIIFYDSTCKKTEIVFEYDDSIKDVIFVPGTTYCLVTGCFSKKIMRFDFTGKEEPCVFETETEVKKIELVPGTNFFLVSFHQSNKVACFDILGKENLRIFEYEANPCDFIIHNQRNDSERVHYVNKIILIPGTTLFLILGYEKRNIMCCDATGREETRVFEHTQVVHDIALVGETSRFIVAAGRSIVLWDALC